MKLSNHSKMRLKQRTDVERNKFFSLSKLAMKNGINLRHVPLEDGYLRKYMTARVGRYKKYYQGYIFIFSMNSRKLITMYEANEVFKERLESIYNRVRGKKKKCTKKKISKSC